MRHLIIGAGIVGLAIARELQRTRPGSEVVVLDKEPRVAAHQTGHNSGVVHAGVYYPPGSLKATLCRRGVGLLRDYTAQKNLPYDEVGKVVVAVDAPDQDRLVEVHRRAVANGVPGARLIGPSELRELEPHVVGVAALHSPTTAIVDFVAVTQALADDVTTGGGQVLLAHEVVGVRRTHDRVEALVDTPDEQIRIGADRLIIAGGLYVDRLARMVGGSPDPQIVPFRGEYHLLAPNRAHLVRGLVYPVPDPRYPFLGVHLTRRIDGTVDVGPNAVFATAREGYTHWDVNARDLGEAIAWPGMRSLARQHWRTGIAEMAGSLSPRRFADAARRYVPELSDDDLRPGSAGVRAQAVGRDGSLVDDFVIEQIGPVTAIRNAPSPAATSSLAIAEHVVAHLPA
ncbi:L-2-hydroxyglutarate oxidase [Kribbia dieselivorans]|uniref:L-2-hydroxyglutarate oxidase n=1 Tax=Kribbia dieselivorans TaxID=331526 RepID=UPI0008384A2A|nr:L-2-hydroxyglutarate oxidase [Kribbia dieselivorans]